MKAQQVGDKCWPQLNIKVTRCCKVSDQKPGKVDETPEMDDTTALWTQRPVEGREKKLGWRFNSSVPINDTVM
ncbi:MAG: hypothetical protein CM15mP120_10150 [Pseudomonadota bacterium]|nr:MAG: hypothetical protein CM15mP120_10150 [Pseudomonadota bacterium]